MCLIISAALGDCSEPKQTSKLVSYIYICIYIFFNFTTQIYICYFVLFYAVVLEALYWDSDKTHEKIAIYTNLSFFYVYFSWLM